MWKQQNNKLQNLMQKYSIESKIVKKFKSFNVWGGGGGEGYKFTSF